MANSNNLYMGGGKSSYNPMTGVRSSSEWWCDLNKYNTYLKIYGDKIKEMIGEENKIREAIKTIYNVYSDDNSENVYKFLMGNGEWCGRIFR